MQSTNLSMGGRGVPSVQHENLTWLLGPTNRIVKFPSSLLHEHLEGLTSHLESIGFFKDRRPSNVYHSTVIPDIECNLRCGYCIQNLSVKGNSVTRIPGDSMKPHVLQQSLRFIQSECRRQGKQSVDLLIFGGEPTKNLGLCCDLLRGIPNLSHADMVTNATLLTRSALKELRDLGLGSLQVTFDGAQDDHDTVRVNRAGRGTYKRIIRNLVACSGIDGLAWKLRVNVTATNLAGIPALIADLSSQLDPRCYEIEFALVDDNGIGWNDGLSASQPVTGRLAELYRLADAAGFDTGLPASGFCNYCSESFGRGGSVIDPLGQLSSCWDTAGFPDKSVGTVFGGYRPEAEYGHRWVSCGYQSQNRQNGPEDTSLRLLLFELHIARLARAGLLETS